MAENNDGNDETQNSGFIPEILVVEQHGDEGEDESEDEEEEDFSEIQSSKELAENISDSEMYDNLDIALNNPRRVNRQQQNNYKGQPANSSCCLLI